MALLIAEAENGAILFRQDFSNKASEVSSCSMEIVGWPSGVVCPDLRLLPLRSFGVSSLGL